ncbi:hypothetical protein GCM10025867_16520 [Frondihabitans sucicola]|uniref:Major facilitator superfamily (MFS) profile domain-containing protein n=1 Tax=Frondihabitans sucicola TaxID=1268041 RepID=A0ABM8GLW8_9MICO|nr:hypothetical protein GCM10025867_16520 [Frondihabitans sucicola]
MSVTTAAAKTARIGTLTAALLAACIAFQLNASMLSPVLVTMATELHTDQATIGLSQTLFFTAAALFSLFLPRLSDIIGRKRVLAWMLVVMFAGSIIAALAVNVPMLFAGRMIQGVAGPVVPICLLMLRSEVKDPKRYGVTMGLITAVNGGIAGIDALAGGWLATNFGFRSVFWVIAAIAALAVVFVAVWGVESRPSGDVRMDWWGSCRSSSRSAPSSRRSTRPANWPRRTGVSSSAGWSSRSWPSSPSGSSRTGFASR